jgi:hypothetical protein
LRGLEELAAYAWRIHDKLRCGNRQWVEFLCVLGLAACSGIRVHRALRCQVSDPLVCSACGMQRWSGKPTTKVFRQGLAQIDWSVVGANGFGLACGIEAGRCDGIRVSWCESGLKHGNRQLSSWCRVRVTGSSPTDLLAILVSAGGDGWRVDDIRVSDG